MITYIYSPCGTSLLTNQADPEARRLIGTYANSKREEIPEEAVSRLETLIKSARSSLADASIQNVARLSAELNAIVKFYGGRFNQSDVHYLISSDTWLGNETAHLIQSWLEIQGFKTVQIHSIQDLRTDHLESFQMALSEFVRWCEVNIKPLRESQSHIVFNLTGGFKSVQGFLQTLAIFYADEAIYVFESGDELLRIPRLPVRMVPDEIIRENLTVFRRLALNLPVDEADVKPLPESLRIGLEFDGTIQWALSPWGELVWNQVKKDLYGESFHPSVSDKIVYGNNFLKSIGNQPTDRLYNLNSRIDDLAIYLEGGAKNLTSLDLKELKGNPIPGSTHQMDAWSDRAANRIYLHFENGKAILDKLDRKIANM